MKLQRLQNRSERNEVFTLREQLNHERATNERLRERMRYLSELQQRTPTYTPKGEPLMLIAISHIFKFFLKTFANVAELSFVFISENKRL